MTEIIFLLSGIIAGLFFMYVKNNKSVSVVTDEYRTALEAERERRIKAESELKAFIIAQENNKSYLQNTVQSFASQALSVNNDNFIKMASQTMEKYFQKANTDMDKNTERLNHLINPLKESITKHELLVKDLQLSNSNIFGNIQNYIQELGKQQKMLEKETQSLVTALKAPKVRGRWGEIGLRRIVEFSGLSEFCDFTEQTVVNDEDDKRLRPDMIVNLPDNKKIVIDSKLPLSAYLDAVEATTDESRDQKLELHAKAVATHVKQLSSKGYWSQFDSSVDFVVLYIEVEPAFGAALSYNNQLITDAIQNRIVFATPTTLITLLQTVAYTWKQHKATENAIEIWKASVELYDRLAVFSEYFSKIGQQLNTAAKVYNQAVGSWESRVIPGIRKIENIGVNSEKKKISSITDIDTAIRDLNTEQI